MNTELEKKNFRKNASSQQPSNDRFTNSIAKLKMLKTPDPYINQINERNCNLRCQNRKHLFYKPTFIMHNKKKNPTFLLYLFQYKNNCTTWLSYHLKEWNSHSGSVLTPCKRNSTWNTEKTHKHAPMEDKKKRKLTFVEPPKKSQTFWGTPRVEHNRTRLSFLVSSQNVNKRANVIA